MYKSIYKLIVFSIFIWELLLFQIGYIVSHIATIASINYFTLKWKLLKIKFLDFGKKKTEKNRKIGSNVVKNNESDSKRWNPSRWGTAVAQANSSLSIV